MGSQRKNVVGAPPGVYVVPVKLLLVDGSYYVYRSFFAIRELSNSRGEPTNAIYGFVKALRKMLRDVQPDRAAVLWDDGLPQRRTQLQPEYKQQRSEMPELMRPQIAHIRQIVPLMGVTSLRLPDTEADDLIAAYTCAAEPQGMEVVLATNDKDLFQLVNERVRVYSTNKADFASPKDGFALLGADYVREKWGVEPGQIGDVLCLVGDASDNIPGVSGLGPKRAAALIQEFGSIDSLLARVDSIGNEGIREKVAGAREQILSNQEMVRLDTHLALPAPLEELAICPRYDELLTALEPWEFQSLTAEIRAEAARLAQPRQGELF
ncbi:MAG: 5'-3' exonuclease H3TH domain-containing protein [Verrucomicrobiota bacterium]